MEADNSKPGFIGEVDFRQDVNCYTFTVTKPLTFIAATGEVITVPKNFTTDLASIPDFAKCGVVLVLVGLLLHHYLHLWFLFGLESLPIPLGFLVIWFSGRLHHHGRYTSAAILHDWLYGTKPFERAHCDRLFRESLEDCYTEDGQRIVIYWAVRAWGWYAWRYESKDRMIPKSQNS